MRSIRFYRQSPCKDQNYHQVQFFSQIVLSMKERLQITALHFEVNAYTGCGNSALCIIINANPTFITCHKCRFNPKSNINSLHVAINVSVQF